MPTMNVGIVAKSHLREAMPHLAEIESWLEARGVGTVFEAATAALMPPNPKRQLADKGELVTRVDLIVVLGGDGTLLSVAGCIASADVDVPILGVNFGSLGFLTEATLPELYPSLEAALAGRAKVEARMMLRATTIRQGAALPEQLALNDVVITKSARARMTDLSVSVGEEFVTRVKADGLIVATPTGSTAYNLSAGGPILHPSADAIVLTPLAPHTLTNRPLVLPATSRITLKPIVAPESDPVLTFDGQYGIPLEAGDLVAIARAPRVLRLLRTSARTHFDVLREKLKWGG